MPPSVQIVERVEDEVEALEPVDVELGIFDVGMMRFDLDVRVEFAGGLFRDLFTSWISGASLLADLAALWPYQSFRRLDVFVSEKELPVQVA